MNLPKKKKMTNPKTMHPKITKIIQFYQKNKQELLNQLKMKKQKKNQKRRRKKL